MIQRRFLVIDDDRVSLVGYPLPLSPTERRVLVTICNNSFPTPESLLEDLNHEISRESLIVHIHAINRKAKAVSGRPLLMMSFGAYHLNPNM